MQLTAALIALTLATSAALVLTPSHLLARPARPALSIAMNDNPFESFLNSLKETGESMKEGREKEAKSAADDEGGDAGWFGGFSFGGEKKKVCRALPVLHTLQLYRPYTCSV